MTKTASGTKKITISKKEWQAIGKKAGWTEPFYGNPRNFWNARSIFQENSKYLDVPPDRGGFKKGEITPKTKTHSYEPPYKLEKLPAKLRSCPIHSWRAITGIELIHKEPDGKELERIWKNWNLMDEKSKKISEKKSVELFGLTNQQHYEKLKKEFKHLKEAMSQDEIPQTLYHATYSPLLNSIMQNGLGGNNRKNWEDSVRGTVYC